MYHVSAQGVDERIINVHYYYYYYNKVGFSLSPCRCQTPQNGRVIIKLIAATLQWKWTHDSSEKN